MIWICATSSDCLPKMNYGSFDRRCCVCYPAKPRKSYSVVNSACVWQKSEPPFIDHPTTRPSQWRESPTRRPFAVEDT